MKKAILFTFMILSLLLAACAGSTPTPTTAPVETQPTEEPEVEEVEATPETVSVETVDLSGTSWSWSAFTNPNEEITVEMPDDYILAFNDDSTVNIKADCNNAVGTYTLDGSSISIEVGPMTMAACPPETRSDDFIKYLGSSAIFFYEEGNLYIDLMADGGTMAFAPLDMMTTSDEEGAVADAASLSTNAWKWERFSNPIEQFDVTEPEKYVVNFLQDNVIVVGTDCNTATGTYTVDGQSLKIELGPTTLAACPEGSLSEDFLKYIQSAAIFTVADGNLMIDLFADDGTMQFGVFDPLAIARAKFKVNSWDEVLERVMAGEFCDAPGVVLLADTPQGRFLKAQGLASTEDGTPIATGDSFEIGSNTKSFTTVLAMQLQEEGLWSLDDPMAKYLPEMAAKLPYGDQVTLRQLAQNNSGISDYANPLMGGALLNDTFSQDYTPEELVNYVIENLQPSFEPGQDWEYSTTNFILLGLAVEAVTGKPLGELYKERIFEPLDMTNSFLLEGIPEDGQIIKGYYTMEDGSIKNVTAWNGSQGWAGGGIVSTAEDMAKYTSGLSRFALFKDPASLEQYITFGDGFVALFDGYGLGVGRWSKDPLAWGHAGQTPGFQTLWAVFPDQDSLVIFMTNSGSCKVASLIPILTAAPDLFTQELP